MSIYYSELFSKTWTKGHWLQDDLWPQVFLRSHVWLYPRIIATKSHENTSKYVDTVTFFLKNLNQRSLTPRWPLTPCLLRSHVWFYPRIIASKSHGSTSMYGDTVINFAKKYKTYYIHTTYYVQNEYHIVSFWTQFRRDNNSIKSYLETWQVWILLGWFKWWWCFQAAICNYKKHMSYYQGI